MKKLLLTLLVLMPMYLFAQAPQKIAIVNAQAILMDMPETKAMQTELDKLKKKYEDTIVTMRQELQKKYEEYVAQQDTMIETIKLRKQQDIQDIQKRIEDLMNVANEDIQKKQIELMNPIQQKLKSAIDKVGAENGYAYILDAQMMHYVGATGIDCTSKVRTQLGLK